MLSPKNSENRQLSIPLAKSSKPYYIDNVQTPLKLAVMAKI